MLHSMGLPRVVHNLAAEQQQQLHQDGPRKLVEKQELFSNRESAWLIGKKEHFKSNYLGGLNLLSYFLTSSFMLS